tara:strand:+ start:531 stop:941 length:411 start_codon:yes stop_codon:yes gene_type:complete
MASKVGFTCGAFDLLHAGHVIMLEECKQYCDHLIVGLQVDPSVDREEKNKPIQTIFERYIQLDAIKFIDKIIPYSTELDLLNLLNSLMPNIRFLDENYKNKIFTGSDNKNIEIYYNKRHHNFSSSELIKRCANATI